MIKCTTTTSVIKPCKTSCVVAAPVANAILKGKQELCPLHHSKWLPLFEIEIDASLSLSHFQIFSYLLAKGPGTLVASRNLLHASLISCRPSLSNSRPCRSVFSSSNVSLADSPTLVSTGPKRLHTKYTVTTVNNMVPNLGRTRIRESILRCFLSK